MNQLAGATGRKRHTLNLLELFTQTDEVVSYKNRKTKYNQVEPIPAFTPEAK